MSCRLSALSFEFMIWYRGSLFLRLIFCFAHQKHATKQKKNTIVTEGARDHWIAVAIYPYTIYGMPAQLATIQSKNKPRPRTILSGQADLQQVLHICNEPVET